MDEGRGEAVLHLATITSDIRHPSITELTWSPELNFSEPRSGSEAISSVYTYNVFGSQIFLADGKYFCVSTCLVSWSISVKSAEPESVPVKM